MLVHILVFGLLGIVLGLGSMKLTDKLIADRLEPGMTVVNIKNKYTPFIWSAVMAAVFILLCFNKSSDVARVECILMICVCACIGMVDISIRRVPNQLLLVLMCMRIIFAAVDMVFVTGFRMEVITGALAGLLLGYFIFMLPAYLHVPIGAGDIKYAAVVGFYFGLMGFLQVMVLMGVCVFAYYLYLRIAGKGNRKSFVAMGPFMALGMIAVKTWMLW